MKVLTASTFNILEGFGGIAGARWWLVGAEQGMASAIAAMLLNREFREDRDYRRFAHARLRLARRELRKARAEFYGQQARNDARRALVRDLEGNHDG